MASATVTLPVAPAVTPTLGRELLATLEAIGDGFARIKRIFACLAQMKNGDGSLASHFAQVVTIVGYTANPQATDTTANGCAKLSYDELNAFITAAGASLEQCCAKHKQ